MIVSDIKYHFLFIVALDPPMTKEMERALPEIFAKELESMGLGLESLSLKSGYHMISVKAAPELAPMTIADEIRRNVSGRLIARFHEKLSGWGAVYRDQMMIKTGSRITQPRASEFVSLSTQGI